MNKRRTSRNKKSLRTKVCLQELDYKYKVYEFYGVFYRRLKFLRMSKYTNGNQ